MRKLLLITLPLLLIVGCSKEPINYENTLIKRDGLYTNWYKNGQKKIESFHKLHIPPAETFPSVKSKVTSIGKWTLWYKNGQIKSKVNYKDGKLNSKWKVWHGNGKLAEEGEYKVGEKIGEWIYYKKDGFIDKVKTY